MSAGLHSLLCRPEHPYAVRKNYLSSTVKRIRLTFLSNVVAYPCRHSRKRIGIMSTVHAFFAHPLPATRVSATRVLSRPLPSAGEELSAVSLSHFWGPLHPLQSSTNLGNLGNLGNLHRLSRGPRASP